jgi:hypothetical protein
VTGSGRGLDWLNFFVSAVQTGFGAFATVYLVKNNWPPQAIGLALTIATMSSLFSPIPARAALGDARFGQFVDRARDRRDQPDAGRASRTERADRLQCTVRFHRQ